MGTQRKFFDGAPLIFRLKSFSLAFFFVSAGRGLREQSNELGKAPMYGNSRNSEK